MTERPIPLMKIGEYTSMRIAQPPPFRDRLAVDLEACKEALRVANIDTQAIAIRFIPREYIQDVRSVGYWEMRYSSRPRAQPKPNVMLDLNGNLAWNFQYDEFDVLNQYQTAEFASRAFCRAMQVSPLVLIPQSSVSDVLNRNLVPAWRFVSFKRAIHSLIVVSSQGG